MKLIKIMSGLTVIISLSGCSSMFSNQARCPFNDQGGCQSVESVNKMIDQRKFTDHGRFVQQAGAGDTTIKKSFAPSKSWSGWNSPTPFSGSPMRTPEIDARMWVSPWQDTDNSYHGSSYITFVVQQSHWNNLPAKAIVNNDYDDGES